MSYMAMNRIDLSEYKMLPGEVSGSKCDTVLNVGWLSGDYDFSTAEPSEEFINALRYLVSTSFVNVERGYEYCPLCLPERPKDLTRANFPKHESFINIYGKEQKLGDCEVWVDGEGEAYAAPNLIFHYVVEHKYAPPEKYISAVIAHYKNSEKRNGVRTQLM